MLFCGTKGPRTPKNRLQRTENLIRFAVFLVYIKPHGQRGVIEVTTVDQADMRGSSSFRILRSRSPSRSMCRPVHEAGKRLFALSHSV